MTWESWSKSDERRLAKLWASPMTARSIAIEMGPIFTRNMILGKAHRMGLPSRARPLETDEARKQRIAAREARSQAARQQKRFEQRKKVESAAAATPFAGDLGIPFVDLRAGQCKFIAAEPPGPLYPACGQPTVDGLSYCPHHQKICWVAREPKDRPDEGGYDRKQSARFSTFEAA